MLQNFNILKPSTIVSDFGFKSIGKIGHTKKMEKKCFKVFEESSINNSWTPVLKSECKKNNVDFLTSPMISTSSKVSINTLRHIK